MTSSSTLTPTGTISTRKDQRRVVFATVVGTTVEWYDFFLYAAATGLVLSELFFKPFGEAGASLVAFATIGLSFLLRPLGAFLAGHFGDKYGRRTVLMATLICMGLATALIGCLPTYDQIGAAAPILLVVLRALQGLSAGGEWGGAALLAVEHAPRNRRSLFGSAPQLGVPLGLILANGVLWLMAIIAPGDAFKQWGWRIPFLLSIVLIFVGYFIRRRVEESPVFEEIAMRQATTKTPIVKLLRFHALLVIITALVFAGNNAVGYMTTGGYIQRYASNPKGDIHLPVGDVLLMVTLSAFVWFASTWFAGWLGDKLGRRNTYTIGWIVQLIGVAALFPLVNLGTELSLFAGLAVLSIGLGMTYGPQAAFYAEAYPASIRFSGVSISYAIGAILGGAFAPTIADFIQQQTHSTAGITWYLAGMTVIGLIATLLLRDRSGIPLGPEHEAEQSKSPIYGLERA